MVDNPTGRMYFDRMRNTTSKQVARLINKGYTVLEVARQLNISPQAVYKHIHQQGLPLPTKKRGK